MVTGWRYGLVIYCSLCAELSLLGDLCFVLGRHIFGVAKMLAHATAGFLFVIINYSSEF